MIDYGATCEGCKTLYEFCQLVDYLIKDIQHLESETVRTRYELSLHLAKPHNEFLRSDILTNLAARYGDNSAYHLFIKLIYNNHDPMESKEWENHIWKLAHGRESDLH